MSTLKITHLSLRLVFQICLNTNYTVLRIQFLKNRILIQYCTMLFVCLTRGRALSSRGPARGLCRGKPCTSQGTEDPSGAPPGGDAAVVAVVAVVVSVVPPTVT